MKVVTEKDITAIGKDALFDDAFRYLTEDFKQWQSFKLSPRHAVHYPHGVFELMPCANDEFYTYKYVNAHPRNPEKGKNSIVALGMLADVETGYPQLVSDMTLLTAVRTAATSAIAAKHFAVPDASIFGFIGTGAQSEFQFTALKRIFNIRSVRYFDHDPRAMDKFRRNLENEGVELISCMSGAEVVSGVDVVTTAICEKAKVVLFSQEDIKNNRNLYINAIGGDCPGKTELDVEVVKNSRIILEYYEQTRYEGEIQNLTTPPRYDELWEVIQKKKPGRTAEDNVILYDAVGFALEDFSMLRMLYERGIGIDVNLLPKTDDPKDLFSVFRKTDIVDVSRSVSETMASKNS
jgi:ornithine cyclodeaminase